MRRAPAHADTAERLEEGLFPFRSRIALANRLARALQISKSCVAPPSHSSSASRKLAAGRRFIRAEPPMAVRFPSLRATPPTSRIRPSPSAALAVPIRIASAARAFTRGGVPERASRTGSSASPAALPSRRAPARSTAHRRPARPSRATARRTPVSRAIPTRTSVCRFRPPSSPTRASHVPSSARRAIEASTAPAYFPITVLASPACRTAAPASSTIPAARAVSCAPVTARRPTRASASRRLRWGATV
jgi:hypothetical protein